MEKKYTMIMVPGTHWDREWYKTFQQLRIRLVELWDELMSLLERDPDFKSWTFDGQTIVIEDYLAIRPEERDRLKKHIEQGRIVVGPWYILPDEFLPSAEATVRNLMLGHKIASEFGKPMKVGYIPDPFGHISQLPQILAGFGINSFIFARGMGEEFENMNSEFWWEAPDGTKVLALNQVNGYGNASLLGCVDEYKHPWVFDRELALETVKKQRDTLSNKASTKYLLLNNGADHLFPQPEIPKWIKYFNEHLEDAEVVMGSFEDLINGIFSEKPELKTYKGELYQSKYFHLLPGVLSSRMYIKQTNERTQTLLEKWAEPSSALAWLLGKRYENAFLWEAWKLLIQNHPHDSICGCSIDKVHQDMMPRFAQSQQIAETLVEKSFAHIDEQIDTKVKTDTEGAQAVVVHNALSWAVTDIVRVRITRKLEPWKNPPFFTVRDAEGNEIPCQIDNERIVDNSGHERFWHGDICFIAKEVPALGYRVYGLEDAKGPWRGESEVEVCEDAVNTNVLNVHVHTNGTFSIYHPPGYFYTGQYNRFEDEDDAGDEYNYSPARQTQKLVHPAEGNVTVTASGPVFATFRVDLTLNIPESLTEDRITRSKDTVPCPLSTFITAYLDIPRVDVVTEIENSAKDHRLRVLHGLESPLASIHAEGHYDVIKRSADIPSGEGWAEKPIGTKPQQSFVSISASHEDINNGKTEYTTVINQGLPEYEVLSSGGNCEVALTLLRCVGWLSRGDLTLRPGYAGPSVETPDAQCLGKHMFRYAVYPHVGDWVEAKAWQQAHQHNVPLRATVVPMHEGTLPNEMSFIKVEPAELVVSAVKKAENSDALILRVYNTTPNAVKAKIGAYKPIRAARLTNMNEEPSGEVPEVSAEGNIGFNVPEFRVQTVMLSF